MKVPYSLRRRPQAEPATAFWLPGNDAEPLLDVCSRLNLAPAGRVHAGAGGFLLKLESPTSASYAGAVRLRSLAANLFIPADSDLLPALLDDEASGLVRDRGLVFLPWGEVSGYDPRRTIDPRGMLQVEKCPRRPWRPFPERAPLAERLAEVVWERPDESPDTLLEAGGSGIGTETPRPESVGPASRILGGATLSAGRGLVWLGQSLGLRGVAAIGAGWVGEALARAPRLGESILGRQAAALRQLLKEFREGDPESALRRALPLGEPGGDRGAKFDTGDQLPTHNLAYSLRELLGSSGRHPPAVWCGDDEVLAQLSYEYRKAAEQALRAGDFRRAAFIYGKLIRNYRLAANALLRGGLHHDAAILLLTKVDDPLAAARSFESAGETDRALQLYRRLGEHEAAGDLLRRLGEEDIAIVEYRRAAEQLATTSEGNLAAGRLFEHKVGRPDLALHYYRLGWHLRPEPNALPSALAAITVLAKDHAASEIRPLLDEVDDWLEHNGSASDASKFYNEIARVADRSASPQDRDDLRDRALLGLAARLRRQSREGIAAGRLVSELLGQHQIWPAAVVSDAEFAVNVIIKSNTVDDLRSVNPTSYRVAHSEVTCVCATSGGDEILIGFQNGDIFAFRPDGAEVVRIARGDLPAVSLSATYDGRTVVALRLGESQLGSVIAYSRTHDGPYQLALGGMPVDGLRDPWLTPVLTRGTDHIVGLWDGISLYFLDVAHFSSAWSSFSLPRPDAAPRAALLVPLPDGAARPFGVLVHDGREWSLFLDDGSERVGSGFSWTPEQNVQNPLRTIPVAWDHSDAEHVEVTGVGPHGSLHWALFRYDSHGIDLVASNSAASQKRYLAATIVRPRMIAAVTAASIEWLRCGGDRFTLLSTTALSNALVVACFPSLKTNSIILVRDDGIVVSVAIPR